MIDNLTFQEIAMNRRSRMCSLCNGSLRFSAIAYRRKQCFVFGIWYFSKVTKCSLERHSLSGKAFRSKFEIRMKSIVKIIHDRNYRVLLFLEWLYAMDKCEIINYFCSRIMTVTSADEFYSIMGVLTREMLEFTDTNNLIKVQGSYLCSI